MAVFVTVTVTVTVNVCIYQKCILLSNSNALYFVESEVYLASHQFINELCLCKVL